MANVQKVTHDVKEAIKRKSAYMLPNNPTESGWKASDIRKALYEALIGTKESLLTELERVIDEINENFVQSQSFKDGTIQYVVTADGSNLYQIANMEAVINVFSSALDEAKKYADDKVEEVVVEYLNALISGAPDSLNTLKEISDWISGHENGAAEMNSAIQEVKNKIPKVVRLI